MFLPDTLNEHHSASSSRPHERGSMVVFVALLSFVFVGVTALVLDILAATSAQRQLTIISETAALAALETYLAIDPEDLPGVTEAARHQQRLEACLARANEVALENTLLGAPTDSPLGELELSLDGCTDEWCLPDNNYGTLVPGKYYSVRTFDENGNETTPCTPPCFEPNSPSDVAANAFRVSLHTPTPLASFFASAVGHPGFKVSGSSTAAEIPRHGVFLIDLSTSIAGDTHSQHQLSNGGNLWYYGRNWHTHTARSFFAFLPEDIRSRSECAEMRNQVIAEYNAFNEGDPFELPDYSYFQEHICEDDIYPVSGHPIYGYRAPPAIQRPYIWCEMETAPETECGAYWCAWGAVDDDEDEEESHYVSERRLIRPKKHYKRDYQDITVTDYSNGTARAATFVYDHLSATRGRTEVSCGSNDGGYETSWTSRAEPLQSILTGVNAAVNAFQSRAVAGDELAIIGFDSDVYPDAADGQSRLFRLGKDFQLLHQVTALSRVHGEQEEWNTPNYMSAFLFPQPSNTHIRRALERAVTELSRSPLSGASEDFIAIFTDGFGNCVDAASPRCRATYAWWANAMAEIDVNVVPTLEQSNIPLHVFLFGPSGAHTLNHFREDPPDNEFPCVDQNTAQNTGLTLVRGSDCEGEECEELFRDAMRGEDFFYTPNVWFHDWSQRTNGGWFPIRDVDPINGPGFFPSQAASGVPIDCEQDPPQRMMYDPYGRPKAEQVTQAVQSIMKQNPFALVE